MVKLISSPGSKSSFTLKSLLRVTETSSFKRKSFSTRIVPLLVKETSSLISKSPSTIRFPSKLTVASSSIFTSFSAVITPLAPVLMMASSLISTSSSKTEGPFKVIDPPSLTSKFSLPKQIH